MINLIHNCSMNNVVLLLGVFIATLGLTQTSSGLTLGMSSEKILETQQLILLGTVDSVETRSGDTEYDITVLEYVKIPAGFNKVDTLHVVGCGEGQIGGCITFDEGQDVLFILDERDNMHLVSELSFVSPNPNCTMDEIFRYNDEKYDGLSLYQDSKNNRYLYTNQPIIAQYYYFNKNLEATSVDVTIKVVDDFPDILKEETIRLDLDECQPNAKAEMEFVIDSPGFFAISAKVEGNGGGEAISGVKVIDYVVPPLKQLHSAISPDEIVCKNDLVLVQKKSGLPACVASETKEKLIQRNWAVDFPMKYIIDTKYWSATYLVHHTMCAHIGVEKIPEEEAIHRFFWTMTDDDLEKIPIIKSMLEYNSRGLYSSDEYPITSTVVPDDVQNQYMQIFEELASDEVGSWRAFLYDGKYYATVFSIC